MTAPASRPGVEPPDPLIPADGEFVGLLCFRGRAAIAGRLEGEISASGRLEVAEDAVVRARVAVDELVVAGELEGEIEARTRAELGPTARVRGVLRTPNLQLAEGGSLEGTLRTGDAGGPSEPDGGGAPAA